MLNINEYDKFYVVSGSVCTSNMKCEAEEDAASFCEYISNNEVTIIPSKYKHIHGKVLDMGTALTMDYLGVSSCIVSEKVKDIFVKNNITGVKFLPVSVKTRKGDYLNYYILDVVHSISFADRRKSKMAYYAFEDDSFLWRDVGLYFPLNEWNGADVFYQEDRYITVTEKAENIFKKYKSACIIYSCRRYEWAPYRQSDRLRDKNEKISLEKVDRINGFKTEIEFGRSHEFHVGDLIEHQVFGKGIVKGVGIHFKNEIIVSFDPPSIYGNIILDKSLSGIIGIF